MDVILAYIVSTRTYTGGQGLIAVLIRHRYYTEKKKKEVNSYLYANALVAGIIRLASAGVYYTIVCEFYNFFFFFSYIFSREIATCGRGRFPADTRTIYARTRARNGRRRRHIVISRYHGERVVFV